MTMFSADSVYIIGEAGVNHNGSLEMALKLIDVAAKAGVDAVKFQTFNASQLVGANAPMAEYQIKTTKGVESQYEMLRKLELDKSAHHQLIKHCREVGVQFISTPFDLESLDFLAMTLDVPLLKLSSGEITNAPLLLRAALTGKPLILSTGMCTLADIETALGVVAFGYLNRGDSPSTPAFQEAFKSVDGQRLLREKVTLLHCTTEYPSPFNEVNLRAMRTMAAAFGLPVGYSDHTEGIAVPIAAVARGAVVIEKHFTLDRTLPGPDHKASLHPDELHEMVRLIRQVEQSLGSPMKMPSPSEFKNMAVARKSIVAAKEIKCGEPLTSANLAVKRPGSGISPLRFWDILGTKAVRSFSPGEMIEL